MYPGTIRPPAEDVPLAGRLLVVFDDPLGDPQVAQRRLAHRGLRGAQKPADVKFSAAAAGRDRPTR
jgi:hypothetical protein